jgi:hypothetical protein
MHHCIPRSCAPLILVVVAAVFAAGPTQSFADTGQIDGYALAQSGSVVSIPFGGPPTSMSPTGEMQTSGTPLDRNEDVDLGLLGNLTAQFSSANATQSCQGDPDATPVWAECVARVENAVIGVGLPPLLAGGGNLPLATASVIEARVRCESSGTDVICSSAGSHIDNLCPINQSCTNNIAGAPQSIPLGVPGVLGGSLVIGAQVSRTSQGAVTGAGMTVTMLSLQVQLIPVLGGDALLEIQLAQADAFVGGVALDAPEPTPSTPTVEPSQPPAETPTATQPPSTQPPSASPTPPSVPTSSSTVVPPTPSATSTPQPTPSSGPPAFVPPPAGPENLPGPPTDPHLPQPKATPNVPAVPGAPGGPSGPPAEGPTKQPRPSVTPKPPATGNAAEMGSRTSYGAPIAVGVLLATVAGVAATRGRTR